MSDPVTDDDAPDQSPAKAPQLVSAVADAEHPVRSLPWGRWSLILLTLVALCVVYHREARHAVRRFVANRHADAASGLLIDEDIAGALAKVEQALRWLPNDSALVYLRGQMFAENENWEASLQDYTHVIEELAPEFAVVYVKRAAVHEQMGNYALALEDVEQAIKFSPADEPSLLNHHAYLCGLANSKLDTAQVEINQALMLYRAEAERQELPAVEPAAFLDTRGFVYYRLGEYDQALSDIEKALRYLSVERKATLEKLTEHEISVSGPMHAYDQMQGEILYHQGLVRQALGQTEEAEKDFNSATKLGYEVSLAPSQPLAQ
jgi:tetratricopeptide (TPR) repeat protein